MSTSLFPGTSIDTFSDPSATTIRSATGGISPAAVATLANDALFALETKVGINGSAVSTSLDYKVTTLQGQVTALQEQGTILYTDTGIVNAYIITPATAFTSYTAGQRFSFIPANTNTNTSTLNVNGLGNKSIQCGGQVISPGFLSVNQIAMVVYDGTQFQLINPATNLLGSASITSSFTSTTTPTIVDVTNLSVTVTVPAGRNIRIYTQPSYVKESASGVTMVVYLREGSTTLTQALVDFSSGNAGNATPFSLLYEGPVTAGAHTYKVSVSQTGASTMTYGSAGATGPASLFVEMV